MNVQCLYFVPRMNGHNEAVDFSAEKVAKDSKEASQLLQACTIEQRNSVLQAIHDILQRQKDEILRANHVDLENARHASSQYSSALVKRLDLTLPGKFESMVQGVLDIVALPDPLGKVSYANRMDEGLEIRRVSCSIGALLVIFEARPEVVVNIAALALKSGNAAILKGGKESLYTSIQLEAAVKAALMSTSMPVSAIQLVSSRAQVSSLLSQDKYIDLCIPRGSNELVRSIQANTKIPVLGHADGLCCIYLHSDADIDMAIRILIDAKTSYPAGCNAVETLLIHKHILPFAFTQIANSLANVELRCTQEVRDSLREILPNVKVAKDSDFTTEFLGFILAVKTVDSLEEAIAHINQFSSHHTDTIVTQSAKIAAIFQSGVDSAGVYWNASTRFADGFRYGFGAEVGIATGKIHARGPVGLEGLTSYKYLINGNGQIASDYSTGGKQYLHETL